MKKTFEFERTMNSDGAAVWQLLAKLDAVDEWAPMIASCSVEGSGDGAVRHCVLADGSKLRERIVKVDSGARAVHYAIEEGLPLSSYAGVFAVRERDGHALVHWHIEAEGDESSLKQVEAMLSQVAPAMLAGLDQRAAKAA